MKKICAQIAEIIESHVEDMELQEDSYEVGLAGMNSIAFIQIIVELEEKFKVEIPDEYLMLNKMDTVKKMACVIQMLLENANSEQ